MVLAAVAESEVVVGGAPSEVAAIAVAGEHFRTSVGVGLVLVLLRSAHPIVVGARGLVALHHHAVARAAHLDDRPGVAVAADAHGASHSHFRCGDLFLFVGVSVHVRWLLVAGYSMNFLSDNKRITER